MIFEQSWRWYGPQDPVGLESIKQAGARGVVTALHQIPVGEVWSVNQIKEHIKILEESNIKNTFPLHWNVAESLTVHDAIKQGKTERDAFIEKYYCLKSFIREALVPNRVPYSFRYYFYVTL